MFRHQDLKNLIGFREDGRKNHETRKIKCEMGNNPASDGSSYFKMGITEIVCNLQGPIQAEKDDDELINVEYTVASFAGVDRRTYSKSDKEWSQFAEDLRVSFESIICKEAYPRSRINILVTILQSDGSKIFDTFLKILGTKSAIFNAICLALLDAGIAMKDFMVSCTTGIVNYDSLVGISYLILESLLDMTNQEVNQSTSELIISYLPKSDKVSFMQMKTTKTTKNDFEKLMELNISSCKEVYEHMKHYVRETAIKKLICSK